MKLELTELQKVLIRSIAKADKRTPQQSLALLLAEGFRFLYFDKETYSSPETDPEQAMELILKELEESLNK